MRSLRLLARWASSALSVLLLASSLTCLTAVCATLCAPAGDTSVRATAGGPTAAADANLPPCHRRAAAPNGAENDAPAGGCDGTGPCCAKWLNDHATLRLADPATLRTLLPENPVPAVAGLVAATPSFASDPPDRGPMIAGDFAPPSARPRAAFGTRGPPSVAAAA